MKGESSNEREKLDTRLRWLQRGIEAGGLAVVAGLLLEYGPEIKDAIVHRHAPSLAVVGGIMVTLGVAAEVIWGIFLAQTADRVQALADAIIAETNERALALESANLKLGADLAVAQESSAKAQLKLQKSLEYVRRTAGHRSLSPKFAEALKDKPTGAVEILYALEDTEAYVFSLQIWHTLRNAGWLASKPKPIPDESGVPGASMDGAPAQLRHGTSGPLSVIANRIPRLAENANTPAHALMDALRSALEINWGFMPGTNPSLPDDHFVIVVGQK